MARILLPSVGTIIALERAMAQNRAGTSGFEAPRAPAGAGRFHGPGAAQRKICNEPGEPAERYHHVRQQTLELCAPLEIEDCCVQPMPDASPPKWHLAHTTWFFETFVLKPKLHGYLEFHPAFEHLFNSYYNGVGQPFPRAERGNLSRPTIDEVLMYRSHVDTAMHALFDAGLSAETWSTVELGLHHEQQHQELIVTDLKCVLGGNPLHPVYGPSAAAANSAEPQRHDFADMPGGVVDIGHDGDGFAFDNERPRHGVLLRPYQLGTRLITNAEFLDFIEDGGYSRPELWLSDGWSQVQLGRLGPAPLYWRLQDATRCEYRLDGLHPLRPELPVVHVSYFEADAFARWRGARLPTEFEWEAAASAESAESVEHGNFVETGALHPRAPGTSARITQLFGDVWEWTASAYTPYPGFRPHDGALGEYNGKFMCNQMVLRGGSCATPREHIRASYRNFFYPADRWQFSGIRLARDC